LVIEEIGPQVPIGHPSVNGQRTAPLISGSRDTVRGNIEEEQRSDFVGRRCFGQFGEELAEVPIRFMSVGLGALKETI